MRIALPVIVVTMMLLWALYPENPYGYYILLRLVCCSAMAYLAMQALSCKKQGWVWILAVTALVYNPVFRIHLNRSLWSVINIVTIAIAWAGAYSLNSNQAKKSVENKEA